VIGRQVGGNSSKWILSKASETTERLRSKFDNLRIEAGYRIIQRTAGSGGWGDPLERAFADVARDVRHNLVSRERAWTDYGVELTGAGVVDPAASEALRAEIRNARGEPPPRSISVRRWPRYTASRSYCRRGSLDDRRQDTTAIAACGVKRGARWYPGVFCAPSRWPIS
jgi:hypothetical protein